MNNDFEHFLDSINSNELDKFLAKNKSEMLLEINNKQIESDMSWIEVVEETLPYIDRIIRNPRRFITQEEDVVIIEKAKKITKESIKHLAQHTNLIEDIEDDGSIRPNKILNVYKEETIDLYENRFIYSLLYNLGRFVTYKRQNLNINFGNTLKKRLNYKSHTEINNEDVNFNLSLEIKAKSADLLERKDGKTIQERIDNIENILSEYKNTNFIKSLRQVTIVKSPIRKTNIILRDINFRQCVVLWEYMEKNLDTTNVNLENKLEKLESPIINRNLDYTYFIGYNALLLDEEQNLEQKDTKKLIEKLIMELIETGVDESGIKKSISRMYKNIYRQQKEMYNRIEKVYKNFVKNYNRNRNKAIELLK